MFLSGYVLANDGGQQRLSVENFVERNGLSPIAREEHDFYSRWTLIVEVFDPPISLFNISNENKRK